MLIVSQRPAIFQSLIYLRVGDVLRWVLYGSYFRDFRNYPARIYSMWLVLHRLVMMNFFYSF